MQNRLYKGYLMVREDGTKQIYIGWEPNEIKAMEVIDHGYHGTLDFSRKYYSIANSFIHYEYNDEVLTFSEIDDKYDTIMEWTIDAFDSLANHLLTCATEDEERAGAIVEIALDIFGSLEEWNKRALYYRITETEEDFRYIRECKVEYDREDNEA